MVGLEFRGYNLSGAMTLVGVRKFIKGFVNEADGGTTGYNRLVGQNGLEGDWVAKSKRFGFFAVEAIDGVAGGAASPGGLLLDYGRGGNPAYDPSRLVRDYLVKVEESGVLFGKAFLAVGSRRIAAGCFLLEPRGAIVPGKP